MPQHHWDQISYDEFLVFLSIFVVIGCNWTWICNHWMASYAANMGEVPIEIFVGNILPGKIFIIS